MIIQAPFVSNAFWETIFTISRWIGSPMASLAYILWNIRTTARAALMVDMSTELHQRFETAKSNFGSMRDSLYLLTTMNQYSLNQEIRAKREAEGLLRIALFSKDLRLLKLRRTGEGPQNMVTNSMFWGEPVTPQISTSSFPHDSLDERCEPEGHIDAMRQKLALQFRTNRRRGVVPVFISIMWFVFSLAISIQDAFGLLGHNSTAHDLALGCLLCWLPVLILCSIVDRNPVSSDDVKDKLNKLVNRVRESLVDPVIQRDFINAITDVKDRGNMRRWVERIAKAFPDDRGQQVFFKTFAGQGRIRWHYGVAHPILTDIESAHIREKGRNWLQNESQARNLLVLGETDEGLDWFDYRELWQVAMAVIIVVGCVAGGWVISYMTPTVGLGCRSGGYTVFVTAAFGLLTIEMVLWWILDAEKQRLKKFLKKPIVAEARRRTSSFISQHRGSLSPSPEPRGPHFSISRAVHSTLPITGVPQERAREELASRHHLIQKRSSFWFFRPLEFANMTYLCYLIMAQTVGADETCECMTSLWGSNGGYLDFTQWNIANSEYVNHYWIAGTCVSTAVMGLSMIYIIVEWCMQSHLSTADIKSAATGLQNTRRFRYLLYLIYDGLASRISPGSLRWHPYSRNETSVQPNDHRSSLPRSSEVVVPELTAIYVETPRPSVSPSQHSDRRSHEGLLLRQPPPIIARSRSPSEYSWGSRRSPLEPPSPMDDAEPETEWLSPEGWRPTRSRRGTIENDVEGNRVEMSSLAARRLTYGDDDAV